MQAEHHAHVGAADGSVQELAASRLEPKDIPRIHQKKGFYLHFYFLFLWFPAQAKTQNTEVMQPRV